MTFSAEGRVAVAFAGSSEAFAVQTGAVYYDKDAKGGAAAVHFATLLNHPTSLDQGDFVIV